MSYELLLSSPALIYNVTRLLEQDNTLTDSKHHPLLNLTNMFFSRAIPLAILFSSSRCSPLVVGTSSAALVARADLPAEVIESLSTGFINSDTRRDLPPSVITDLQNGFPGGTTEKRNAVKIRSGLDWLPENVRRDFTALLNATQTEEQNDASNIERRDDGSRYSCGGKPWLGVDNWKAGYQLFCGGHVGPGNEIQIGWDQNSRDFIANGKGWRSMVYNTQSTQQDQTKYKNGELGPDAHVYCE
jgi:hypothetical protein